MDREPVVSDRVLTIPNALSVLRLVLVPTFAVLLFTEQDGAAVAVLMVSGFSDYLDGKLARRWAQVSRLGELLDPAVDRLYILTTLLALAYRDVIPWWLVALVIARDAVLTMTLPVLATHGFRPLPVSFLGKAATFNLLCAFPMLLLGTAIDGTGADIARAIGWAFTWWGVSLYWWSALLYLVQVRGAVRSARSEPAPWNDGRPWPAP